MKLFIRLCVVLAAMSASAESLIKARMVETPTTFTTLENSGNLTSVLWGIDAAWPSNINPDAVYLESGQAIPGTNIVGAVLSNGNWHLPAGSGGSNVTTLLTIITNTTISQVFTILTNGAPMMVDYLYLSNTQAVYWQQAVWTNWVGTKYRDIKTWAIVPEPGSGGGTNEIGYDSTNGIVSIPANCLAIMYFRGALKDILANTTYSTSVDFLYASEADAELNSMFLADRDDADEPVAVVRSGDTWFLPPVASARQIKVRVRHIHSSILVDNAVTKDHAIQWQVLLIKFL